MVLYEDYSLVKSLLLLAHSQSNKTNYNRR